MIDNEEKAVVLNCIMDLFDKAFTVLDGVRFGQVNGG
jgi:hypothetical protein